MILRLPAKKKKGDDKSICQGEFVDVGFGVSVDVGVGVCVTVGSGVISAFSAMDVEEGKGVTVRVGSVGKGVTLAVEIGSPATGASLSFIVG